MLKTLLSDRKARRTYVLTKIAVVTAAGIGTIPLAYKIGPRAWYGFLAFAAAMIVLTAAVLAIGSTGASESSSQDESEEDDGEDPDPDPAEPVVIQVEDSLDLHPFPPAEIPDVVADYLQEAHAAGFREVRLIHGRGIGVQRERVRSLLKRHPLVLELHDATPDRGGWGATIAYLKRSKT